ncbi:MAG TPA: cation diffusion facilitator family transporter [Alphaproteobacteria bacterium]|nr:cation diffusion facilitator family transporter [Alphaproteobacteria bacterium]
MSAHHHGHKHSHSHRHDHGSERAVIRVGQISLLVAVGVILFKLAAWWLSGSVALFSDVLESITHIITAGVTLLALKISHRPADRDHPYGHHKIEYFSAMVEAAFIAIAAGLVLREALPRLLAPQMPEINGWVVFTTMMATLLNGGWAAFLLLRGRLAGSPALSADGWHLLTDVGTSVGVLIGLGLALYTGWAIVDPLIACVVAAHILWAGWHVMRDAMSNLMDRAASKRVEDQITALVTAQCGTGAGEIHGLKTRVAGRITFVEFHLVVNGNMSVKKSHGICDRLEQAIATEIPGAQVTIHVEPEGTKH